MEATSNIAQAADTDLARVAICAVLVDLGNNRTEAFVTSAGGSVSTILGARRGRRSSWDCLISTGSRPEPAGARFFDRSKPDGEVWRI